MKKQRKVSPPIQLLDHVWASTNRATGHSWERLNHAMYKALKLAVGAGFEFAERDIRYVIEHYNSGRWLGESAEWIYAYAIVSDNMSAVKSFEAWRQRKPFIAKGVNQNHYNDHAFKHGGGGEQQKCRLAVGFSFKWDGKTVKVTSFASDQLSFTACSYKKTGQYSEKIEKRYTITHAELLQGRAFDRERQSLLARARAAPPEIGAKIVKSLKSVDDFFSMPIERVRKIVDKHAPLPPRPPRSKPVIITQQHIDTAVAAGGCHEARLVVSEYKPGMRSSEIPRQHREWLKQKLPALAAELGFMPPTVAQEAP